MGAVSDAPIDVETKVVDAGTWAKTLTVTVPLESVDKEYNSVCGELGMSMRLPGFRPGKVPRNIIEKKYGDEIKKQVTQNLLQRAMRSAFLKEKLEVVGQPRVDPEKVNMERGKPFEFSIDVEVRPNFELGTYKGLALEQEEVEVLPEEMTTAVDRIRERFAELEDAAADYAMADSDVGNGPLRVIIDGNEVHSEETQLLINGGHVVGAYAHLGDKFLLGAKSGEKRTVEETLGNHFPKEEHRGKKATLEFEIKSIRRRKRPELSDDLANKLGLKSADELKEKIRTQLLESVGNEIQRRTRYDLLDKVVDATPFELPKRLTELMAAQQAQASLQQFSQMGVTPEQLSSAMGEFTADAEKRAIQEMRRYFVIDAISTKESIEVSEEDIDEEIVKLARSRGMKASELYDKLVQDESLPQLETDLKIRKVLEYLTEEATITVVPRKPVEKEKEKAQEGHEHPEHAPAKVEEHGHSHGHEHGHEHGH